MKRVKAACILQTLVFSQKPELGLSVEQALAVNRIEVDRYRKQLDQAKTRYVLVEEVPQEDGSIAVRIKKQYNDTADVSEYF